MNKLPLKLRIFEWAVEKNAPFTSKDVMEGLQDEYGAESQFKEKRIDLYLQSLMGAMMLELNNVEFDQSGALIESYQLTDFGRKRVVHIPR